MWGHHRDRPSRVHVGWGPACIVVSPSGGGRRGLGGVRVGRMRGRGISGFALLLALQFEQHRVAGHEQRAIDHFANETLVRDEGGDLLPVLPQELRGRRLREQTGGRDVQVVAF